MIALSNRLRELIKDYPKYLDDLEEEKTLIVSTAHISLSDELALDQIVDTHVSNDCIYPFYSYMKLRKYDYGFEICIPSDKPEFEDSQELLQKEGIFSESFVILITIAYSLGFNYLRLDIDGPISNHLEIHEW